MVLAGLIGNSVNIVINAVDNFSNTIDKIQADAKKKIKGIAVVAASIGAIGFSVVNLTNAYTKFEPVQRNFNSLIGGYSTDAIEKFRKASYGLIDDFDLMRNANLLFMNIASATPDQFAKLSNAAVLLGRAVGIDATEAFERLTLGIAKGETELLDELGLKLDATVANREYADSIGKSISELTAAERATAALNFILPSLEERIGSLSGLQENAATSMERLNVQWNNAKRELGEVLEPQVQVTADALSGFITIIKNINGDSKILTKTFSSLASSFLAFGGWIKVGLLEIELIFAEWYNKSIKIWGNWINFFIDGINSVIRGLNKLGGNISEIKPIDITKLIDTNKIKRDIEEANKAITKLSNITLGITEEKETGTVFTPNISKSTDEMVKQATTTISLSQLKSTRKSIIEQSMALSEWSSAQDKVNTLLSEAETLQQAINIAKTQGNEITINIENINGLDPSEIANAIQDTLSNQIR